MARVSKPRWADTPAAPGTQAAAGGPHPVGQQQQIGIRLKEATHRLAALRVQQQRAQHHMRIANGGGERQDSLVAKPV